MLLKSAEIKEPSLSKLMVEQFSKKKTLAQSYLKVLSLFALEGLAMDPFLPFTEM